MNNTACAGCKSSPSPTTTALVGWVLESSGRGTLSLICTCLFTIFLCTWVVIHPRVYKRRLLGKLHKLALFLKTIVAPEFVAVEGLQEWSQAKKVVKDCAVYTGGRLKLIHAFYIGMLGLKYRTPRGEKVLWPNQYIWLLQQGLIDWEDHALWGLSEENIRDKSDADSTVKLAALCQVSWFVAQSIMRVVHSLPLSQLETMTLAYIPLFIATYFFWWLKPKDVKTSSVVELPDMLPDQKMAFESMAVSNSFDAEGIGRQDSLWTIWYLTPRLFEKVAEDKAIQEAKAIRETRALQVAKPLQRAKPLHEHKVSRVGKQSSGRKTDVGENANEGHDDLPFAPESDGIVVAYWDPEVYHSKIWPAICLFGASFGGLHLISWNAVFPTFIEQWLWRVAALTSIFSLLIFIHFEKVLFRWGGPRTMISLLTPALYLLSRVVMAGGVIASFRASDPAFIIHMLSQLIGSMFCKGAAVGSIYRYGIYRLSPQIAFPFKSTIYSVQISSFFVMSTIRQVFWDLCEFDGKRL
ncbi:hypothetical protein MMC18_006644 [Xylographa bjoerkii]|nr:hypothetical protein [Xylographa bjoerkii]